MKILMIIACMLAITSTVYSYKAARYYKFRMNMCRCRNEWDLHPETTMRMPDWELLRCASLKDRNVLDGNGKFVPYLTMTLIDDIIYDERRAKIAKEIFNQCYYKKEEREKDSFGYDIFECAASLVLFVS